MPGLDAETLVEKPEPVKDDSSAPATLPVIGIIYPPPEVRNIVDKTASFVARNGPEFESRIRQNELGNPKFNFLNPGDPYHAYYQHKVKEFREGRGQEVSLSGAQVQKSVTSTTQQKQQELLKQAQTQEQQPFVPKDPPPEYEFVADPPSISALDLDIVKLTAQFVARNGRQFLTNLMSREQRNYQFDFLRPQHSLFQYFTKLLEQYTKILIPPKDLMTRLKEESIDPQKVLEIVKYRADWQRHQEAQKRKEEMIIERERIAYAQIDWHDFVVVETVDYQIGEIGNFPPPTTPEEVGARVLMLDRVHKKSDDEDGMERDEDEMQMGSDDEMLDRTGRRDVDSDDDAESEMLRKEETRVREGRDNTQVEDMDEESSDSDDEQRILQLLPGDRRPFSNTSSLPPLPPVPDKVIVKKYDPKLARQQVKSSIGDELISPLTGTKIPANKVQEHMRIGLLDPRWVEQRDNYIHDKLNQESVYAPGTAIEESLKHLAERRTDIFGFGNEETAIGKKIGEEDIRKDDKITWDGHTSSVEAATRAARANITIEDQIHQIHKVKGLLPDEEKEKIGPKPVLDAVSASSISKPPSLSMPSIAKQAQLTQPSVVAAAPPMPQARPPLPPGAPMMAAGAAPVMLIPGGTVPQMAGRQPMMDFSVPQPAPVPQAPYQMMQPGAAPMPNYVPGPPQPMPPMPPMGMKHGMMEMMEEEPVMKKARTEDTLEPEESFLAKFQGPVTFKVVLPNMPDKSEWRLGGQTIELSLPLEDPVSVIKAKLHEVTNMPPGKQKLNWEGLFLKDSNSLAYYNMLPSTVLQLQLKERGGRKK